MNVLTEFWGSLLHSVIIEIADSDTKVLAWTTLKTVGTFYKHRESRKRAYLKRARYWVQIWTGQVWGAYVTSKHFGPVGREILVSVAHEGQPIKNYDLGTTTTYKMTEAMKEWIEWEKTLRQRPERHFILKDSNWRTLREAGLHKQVEGSTA